MEIFVVGLSHKTAPVEVRERLAASETELGEILKQLRLRPYVEEVVYLSTCNRVEVYACSKSGHAGTSELKRYLSERAGCRDHELKNHLYELGGSGAVRHAFRVASSLDSMVLGEPQILGQVKGAFARAQSENTAGSILNKLFQYTFAVAKRVRSETAIAKNAVSLSYAAVELARKIFGDLVGKSVLLLGAGKMGELSAKHLRQAGCGEVMVANRSQERAEDLAARVGGRARSLSDLDLLLERADVVISSTAAPGYVVTGRDAEAASRRRRGRPLVLVDLAVPRDIDPAVGAIDGAYLFDVDDLERVVEANLKERRREATAAERIVDVEVEKFSSWLRGQDVKPTIVALRQKIDALARAEHEKALAALPHLPEKDRQAVQKMVTQLVNKILHEPVSRLGRGDDGAAQLADAARLLFNLDAPEANDDPRAVRAVKTDPSKG